MDFFDRTGKMAVGSRLRMLTDRITADAASVYRMYGVDIRPKWFPVFYELMDGEPKSIRQIALRIGHSHPSVSTIVKEMAKRGLVRVARDGEDGRRSMVRLCPKGRAMAGTLMRQCADVGAAIERLSRQASHDLWEAIGEWEALLEARSLLDRVRDEKRARECAAVRIVPYDPSYQPWFRSLNEAWITARWQLEPEDLRVLDHPQREILDRGGAVFVALRDDEPVGVCALLPPHDPAGGWELAKLAVSPDAQGCGVGRRLCEAVIDRAVALGAPRIFLESNRRLEPALGLYRQLGFRELAACRPAYARGDIRMVLELSGGGSGWEARVLRQEQELSTF